MVRINLLEPRKLADQHLIAEYNEMLMLLGHVRRYPKTKNVPEAYLLGPGHITFFKNKLIYIKRRHELIKKEMMRRGFAPTKTIDLKEFPEELRNDWSPKAKDYDIIKERIRQKVMLKPEWYRYERKKQSPSFFLNLLL